MEGRRKQDQIWIRASYIIGNEAKHVSPNLKHATAKNLGTTSTSTMDFAGVTGLNRTVKFNVPLPKAKTVAIRGRPMSLVEIGSISSLCWRCSLTNISFSEQGSWFDGSDSAAKVVDVENVEEGKRDVQVLEQI